MAYGRRKTTRRARSTGYGATRRKSSTRSRSGYSSRPKRATARRSSTTRRTGGQTIRIVLEQPGGMASNGGPLPTNIAAAMRLLAGDRSAASARTKASKPKN